MATNGKSPFSRKQPDDVYNDVKNRDVYSGQITDRGQKLMPVSAKARIWAGALTSVFVFFGTWAGITGIMLMSNGFMASLNIGSHDNLTFW